VRRRREEEAITRAAERAAEAAASLGLQRRRDPEIATTWRIEGRVDDLDVVVELGSTWQQTSVLRGRWRDWVRVAATRERPFLAPGLTIRPARRTVWEWRDGLPGEPAHVDTAGGVGLRVDPPERVAEVAATLDRLVAAPHAAFPESLAGTRCVLRGSPGPDVAPTIVLRDLLALARELGDDR
jgi:hypothetical protein